ncbi:MAG: peptidoglycan DD-metalloendopeptidase family protein [Fretibacterium sp.]|nr:peptidoglycan DD-metalloendopeptidase family protein [Fretibacterium sp.]
MRSRFCLFLGLLLSAGTLLFALPARAAVSDIDARIAEEEQRRKRLEGRISDYRTRIRELTTKVDTLLGQIDRLQQNEAVAGQELSLLELQRRKVQEDIAFLNAEMARERIKLNELVDRLQNRVVDMYKYGETEELNLLFGSASTFEALESLHLLRMLSRHDELLLMQLQDRMREMELSRRTMDDHRARLVKQGEALKAQRIRYRGSIQQTNNFIGNIRKQKALAEKAAREMEAAQKAVGHTILTLMRRKKEREAQAPQVRGRRGGGDYLAGRGRGSMFDWPVRGPITSAFGRRIHPIFKTKSFHSGIDISAPPGTAVAAAASGEVLFDGWLRGYGQVVILDHGRNYSTVYAHLSSTAVREGQVVQAGRTIGRVGKTGTTTGYHLHFEVRVGSEVKNPLDYLKR